MAGEKVRSGQQKKGNDGTRATPAKNPRGCESYPYGKVNPRPGLQDNKG